MKRLLAILLMLCMLLTACTPAIDTPDTTGDPNQSTADPTDDPNSTDDPNPPDDPKDPRLAEFDTLFGKLNSRYNWALTSQYANPRQISLKYLFYQGFADESSKPTDAEWEELKDKTGFDINYDLTRLPVDKMNQVLTQYFGITLADVEATGFKGLVYLESTNCYYRMGTDAEVVENFKATKVEDLADGTVRLYYTARSYATDHREAHCEAVLKPVGDGYQILSNLQADNIGEDPRLAEFDALFGDTSSWYNRALTSQYADPAQITLHKLFRGGFSDESKDPTPEEWEELKNVPGVSVDFYFTRLPLNKMDQVLTQYFGITLEDVETPGFEHLVYLKSSDSYCHMNQYIAVMENFKATAVETLADGTIRMSYIGGYEQESYVAILRPVGDGYQILSNLRADNNGEDPRLANFDVLFGNMTHSENRALTSLYEDPSQVNLKLLFYSGFPLESQKPTEAERDELQDKPGLMLELDLMRLPVEKMDQVLMQLFGITVEDMEDSSFQGLVYLESTNCYYHTVGDVEVVENFKATRVESMEDGTVRVYYTASSRATEYDETRECVVTLKLVYGLWQILSNQKA